MKKKPKKLCKFFTQYVVTRRDMHVFKIFVSWNEIMWIRAICCYLRIESSFELRLCGGTCHWVMKCLPRWICCTFRKAAWTINKNPPVNKRTNGTPWGVHDVKITSQRVRGGQNYPSKGTIWPFFFQIKYEGVKITPQAVKYATLSTGEW